MAQAYKCDICGEFYGKDIPLFVAEYIDAYFYCMKSLNIKNVYCNICPSCIAAIQTVINERKKEGDNDQY